MTYETDMSHLELERETLGVCGHDCHERFMAELELERAGPVFTSLQTYSERRRRMEETRYLSTRKIIK